MKDWWFIVLLLIVVGAGVLWGVWSIRRFERKCKEEAEASYQRTLELARQGKCPYPPPRHLLNMGE